MTTIATTKKEKETPSGTDNNDNDADRYRVEIADLKAGRDTYDDSILPNRFQYHLKQSVRGNIIRDGPDYAALQHHWEEFECAEDKERLHVEVDRGQFRIVPISLQYKVLEGGGLTVEDVGLLEFAGWSESEVEKLIGVEPLNEINAKRLNHDESWSLDDLLLADLGKNTDAVFGPFRKREGGFFVSGTGIGKSVLTNQLVIGLACDRPDISFNLKSHIGPLRQLVIQAENDKTANAQAIQGVFKSYNLTVDERRLVRENVEWKRWSGRNLRGHAFLDRLERAINKSKPHVAWIDPLIAFSDGSLTDDEKVADFFYGRVDEIMTRTGTNIIFVHHTPKASHKGSPAKGGERAHGGFGSSYLGNWPREVFTLTERHGNDYGRVTATLSSTKRLEGQAGFLSFEDGTPVDEIVIQHGDGEVYWEQRSDPKKVRAAAKSLTDDEKHEKYVAVFISAFDKLADEKGEESVPKKEVWNLARASVKSEVGLNLPSPTDTKSVEKRLGVHDSLLNEIPPVGCLFRVLDANGNGSGTRLIERVSLS